MNMPKSYNAVKQLNKAMVAELWPKLFGTDAPDFATIPHRLIWYKIQAAQSDVKIEQRHITRLNKYAKNPADCVERARTLKYELKPGSIITKTYKGRIFTLRVISDNRFEYNGETYTSLSAAAQAMIGMKVAGTDFFGLRNKTCSALNIT